MKILGTGLSGLVGSRIIELLSSYSFEDISLSTGVDITNKKNVLKRIIASEAPVVLHVAAKAHVDGCEEDKSKGHDGDAWKINVDGTQNVVEACEAANKKIMYISTDFVFDGEKEFYSEQDSPNPLNWYAQTKFEGEKIVQQSRIPWVIARIAYPYRAYFERNDFVRTVLSLLQQKKQLQLVTDHVMTPTFVDDIAQAFDVLVQGQPQGIFHVVGSEFVTPFEAAHTIASVFSLETGSILSTTREEYFRGRAIRPFSLKLKNDKITQLGVQMSAFTQGLQLVKKQIAESTTL